MVAHTAIVIKMSCDKVLASSAGLKWESLGRHSTGINPINIIATYVVEGLRIKWNVGISGCWTAGA